MQEWMTDKELRPPRWYEHTNIRRFGRNIYVNTPRIGTVGLHFEIYCFHGFNLGLAVYRDADDGNWIVNPGFGVIDVRITRVRYFTKRAASRQRERYVAEQSQRIVVEAEQFLEDH